MPAPDGVDVGHDDRDPAGEARLVAQPRPGDNAEPISVGQLSSAIKRAIETDFGHVRVRGEISGFKRAASGHVYFALKDQDALIDAVMWKGAAARLAFAAEDGLDVIATGKVTTYPGRSKYQIIVDSIELAGEGALMALLEKTRMRLASEGLFDQTRKQALPFLPRVIGVVTSPTGSVIRDILHRLADRMPTHVLVWPVLVQGTGAAEQVASAITGFDALAVDGSIARPDLLIVARGGGSIEDLWSFNEEVVVRAVANCRIPLISAVGHETDTTLIDFVSDMRAPTPTAAAEMAVPVRAELEAELAERGSRIARAWARLGGIARERFAARADRIPPLERLLAPQRQLLDDSDGRLAVIFRQTMTAASHQLAQLSAGLRPVTLTQRVAAAQERLDAMWRLLHSLDPRQMMARGFAIVRDCGGAIMTSAMRAQEARLMLLSFADGDVAVRVDDGRPEDGPAVHSAPRKAKSPTPKGRPGQPGLFD